MALPLVAQRSARGAISPARTRALRRNMAILQIDSAVEADTARTVQRAAQRPASATQSAAKATAEPAAATQKLGGCRS